MNITPVQVTKKKIKINDAYENFRARIEIAALDRIHEDHHATYASTGAVDFYHEFWSTRPYGSPTLDSLQELIERKLRSYDLN